MIRPNPQPEPEEEVCCSDDILFQKNRDIKSLGVEGVCVFCGGGFFVGGGVFVVVIVVVCFGF